MFLKNYKIIIAILIVCGVFTSTYGQIIRSIGFLNSSKTRVPKNSYAYRYSTRVWNINSCEDDIIIFMFETPGNYELRANGTSINKCFGCNSFSVPVAPFTSSVMIDLDGILDPETVEAWQVQRKDEIIGMNWEVGYNDTLIVCTKTGLVLPPNVKYLTAYSEASTLINNEFFFKVNGNFSPSLNIMSLKDGDRVRLCKRKGVDNYSFPECTKEVADTLYSQPVTVKLSNTSGFLAGEIIRTTKEICPGDSILLSVFAKGCMKGYLKDGEEYPSTIWMDRNQSGYMPYNQASLTSPGIYNAIGYDTRQCNNYYNCPAISQDYIVVEKSNCRDHRLFGKVFLDKNANSKYEAGEVVYGGVKIKIIDLAKDTVIGYAMTNKEGDYDFRTNRTLGNGCKIQLYDKGYQYNEKSITTIGTFNKVNLTTYKKDYNVKVLLSTGRNRPGFEVPIDITLSNMDTVTINQYKLELKLDNQYIDLPYFSHTPASTSLPNIVWQSTSLKPGQTVHFKVFARLHPKAPLGDVLNLKVIFTPTPFDSDISDNVQNLYPLITGSYDPNEKIVRTDASDPSYVKDNHTLDYTIFFQNLGTDTAFNIAVKDKLSPWLDFGTFQSLDASHSYELNLEDDTLIWTFKNILLPDAKVNEPGSHGYIHFKIKPKPQTPEGIQIKNKADIYFDYNDPIETNTTSLTFGTPLVTSNAIGIEKGKISYYPNPSKGTLVIASEGKGFFEILNMNGQVLFNSNLNTSKQEISFSQIKPGTYITRFNSGESVLFGKLIVVQ